MHIKGELKCFLENYKWLLIIEWLNIAEYAEKGILLTKAKQKRFIVRLVMKRCTEIKTKKLKRVKSNKQNYFKLNTKSIILCLLKRNMENIE